MHWGDIAFNLDPAVSEFFEDGVYVFSKSDNSKRTPSEMVLLWQEWLKKYAGIYSLEDGLAEDDWNGGRELTRRLGAKMQLVGDDIFVTNPEILRRGISEAVANSVLIKLNQIGTVTETLRCIDLARKSGYTCVVSHRSGETDDTTIADFTVATGVGKIKTGSASRGERVAKYNSLLEIEAELGGDAKYAGREVYARWMGETANK